MFTLCVLCVSVVNKDYEDSSGRQIVGSTFMMAFHQLDQRRFERHHCMAKFGEVVRLAERSLVMHEQGLHRLLGALLGMEGNVVQ